MMAKWSSRTSRTSASGASASRPGNMAELLLSEGIVQILRDFQSQVGGPECDFLKAGGPLRGHPLFLRHDLAKRPEEEAEVRKVATRPAFPEPAGPLRRR